MGGRIQCCSKFPYGLTLEPRITRKPFVFYFCNKNDVNSESLIGRLAIFLWASRTTLRHKPFPLPQLLTCPASETWITRAGWYHFVLQEHPLELGGEHNSGQVKLGNIRLTADNYCHLRQSVWVTIFKYNNYRTLSINQCERQLRPSAPIFPPFSRDGFYLPLPRLIIQLECPNQIKERHVNTPDAS